VNWRLVTGENRLVSTVAKTDTPLALGNTM